MNATTLTLIELLAKGTAVLLVGFGCIALLRRHSAAQRSLAWLAVFAVMLVLPLGILVRPLWTVPVQIVSTRVALPDHAIPQVIEHSSEVTPIAAPQPAAFVPWTLWQWLAAIYLTGVAALLAFRCIGSWQLRALRLAASAPTGSLAERVRERQQAHGIRRSIATLVSAQVHVPMTWGTLKPVLMLPASCTEWSAAELRAALDHELTHIAHRDAARRWLGTFVTALWWPHPLVWMASKAWKLEQERACDDAVLRAGSDAEGYASQLIQAAHSIRLGSFQSAAALVMAMPSGLETRLRAVVSDNENRSPSGRAALVAASISALFIATLAAVCQAQSFSPDKRHIRITTKFIAISPNGFATDSVPLPAALIAKEGSMLSDPDFQVLIRTLSQRKGVDMMSAPTCTTKGGQSATMEVIREFVYPVALDADGITPTEFEIKNIGVMCYVNPTVMKEGVTLELEPMVRELEGFSIFSAPGEWFTTPEQANKKRKKGELPKPLFYELSWKDKITLKPGQWLVRELAPTAASTRFVEITSKDGQTTKKKLATAPVTPPATSKQWGQRIWFTVNAELVKPDATPKNLSASITISGPTFETFGWVKRQGKYAMSKDMTVADAVRESGGLSDFANSTAVKLVRNEDAKKETLVLDLSKDGATPLKSGDTLIVAEAKAVPVLLAKAKKLIFPKVEFKDATLTEAVEFLRVKSLQLDPEIKGINIIVKADTTPTAKITLNLHDVPFDELLEYVVQLANAKAEYQANAVVIGPLK